MLHRLALALLIALAAVAPALAEDAPVYLPLVQGASPPATQAPSTAAPTSAAPGTSVPRSTALAGPGATATPTRTTTPTATQAGVPRATAAGTATPTATSSPTPGAGCDPSYPTLCLPPPPPDLNCSDVGARNFPVLPPDPHRLDQDGDGIGCEG